ncbi:flavin-containing monooxygenase [Amycolatopsis dongchuanensis]|uniref:NAD(P)-binding domain-containing protein n=1 Tax=Amycolatopsis dongchuanensis TaxID=1070866 RepID=A0ABP8VI26_9PSEU
MAVAVIGAGPGGLAAAKAATEHGLRPVVFERAPAIGGVWRADGAAWPGMTTNLSHPLCAFSDLPWPADTPDFPTRQQVEEYLHRYVRRFGLDGYLRLGHEVRAVERDGDGWIVTHRERERFDGVIVASGVYSRPHVPRVPGRFAGVALHSSGYRTAAELPEGPVVVAGMSFSGSEIAAELAEAGRPVTLVASRPMWLLPRYVDGVPRDLISFTRQRATLSSAEANRRFHELGANPGRFDSRLWLDPDSSAPPFTLPTHRLPERLADGSVRLEPGRVARLDGDAVVLDTGVRLPCATVLWCTGYHVDLPFLSAPDRSALGFEPDDLLQPLLLHRCTFAPGLPRMAFVGLYRGPFFAVLELQARWAAAVLSGAQAPPSGMREGVAAEARIRAARPRPQFPHGDYVGLADALAAELGVLPDLSPGGEHYDALWRGPVVAAHYRLRGPGSDPETAARQLLRNPG